MVDALLIRDNADPSPTPGDVVLHDFLVGLGFTVTYGLDTDAEVTSGYDVVVITESTSSTDIGTKYKDSTIPVINCQNGTWDDHNYLSSTALTNTNKVDIQIADDTHPLAGGLSGNGIVIYTATGDQKYAFEDHLPASAIKVVTTAGNPTEWVLVGFEQGATLHNSDTTESRRVIMNAYDISLPLFTTNYKWMFEAAVRWVTELEVGAGFAVDAKMILHVGESPLLPEDDERAADRIRETLGHRMTCFEDADVTVADADGFDAVFISKTTDSIDVQNRFKNFVGGVWTYEDNLQAISIAGNPYMAFIDLTDPPGTAWHGPTTQWYINPSADAALTGGLSGLTTIYSSSQESTYAPIQGDNNGALPASAARVGEFDAQSDGRWSYYVYESGDTIADGTTAFGRRVFFGLYSTNSTTTFEFLTADGLTLFDASIDWVVAESGGGGGGISEPGYVSLSGNSGSFVDTGTTTGLEVTGAIDLRACVRMDSPLATNGLINKLLSNAGYRLLVVSTGAIQLGWGEGGANRFRASNTGEVPADTDIWVRATIDPSTGDWAIYTSLDPPETLPGAVTWSLALSGSFGATTIATNSVDVELGTRDSGNEWAGRYYQAQILEDGVEVANPNFTIEDQTSDGGLTFVDDHSQTWTLLGDSVWVEPVTETAIVKLQAESNSLSESALRFSGFVRVQGDTLNIGIGFDQLVRIVDESVSLTELESTLRALLRLVVETNAATETAQAILALLRIHNETESMSETVTRIRGLIRAESEPLSLVENTTFLRTLIRAVEESVSLLENDTHVRGLLRVHLDTLTASEAVTPVRFLLRAVNEGISLSEATLALRGLIRAVDEAISLTETDDLLRSRLQLVSESLSLVEADAHIRGLVRLIGESTSISETDFNIRGLFRLVADSLSITETEERYRGLFKVQDETLSLAEADLALRGLLHLVADSLSVTETDDRLRDLIRAVNETISLSETSLTLRALIRLTSETLNIPEAEIRVRALIRTQLETLALSETDIAARELIRVFSDSLSISETDLTTLSRALLKIVNETLNIGTLSGELISVVNETLGISEAAQNIIGRLRVVVESLSTTEDVIRLRDLLRAINETLELSETPLTARALTRLQLETVTASELTIRVRALIREVSDTLNLDEATANLLGLVRVISETSDLTEDEIAIVTAIAEEIVKVVAESLVLTDADLVFRGLFKIQDETVTMAETVATLRALARIQSEVLGVDETDLRLRDLARVQGEAISIVETANRIRDLIRTFDESVAVSEQVAVLRGLLRVIEETANLTEDDIRILTTIAEELLRIVNEATNITETDDWLRGIVRTFSESLTTAEAVLMFRALARIQDETLSSSEAAARFRALVRTLNESESISEAAVRVRDLIRIASELANIEDTQIPALGLVRIKAEILSITESVAPIRGFFKIVSETLNATESTLSFVAAAFTGVLRKYRDFRARSRDYIDKDRDYQGKDRDFD